MKKIKVNKNIIWATAFVNELSANGIKFACISPGSRNTPLTFAFASNKKIKKYVFIDERSSAFFALGLAKVKNEPVAIVTTSGTATAEIYPSIIEAYKQRIPLIICTADRPPGFFERGANQAINQQNIYKNHIRAYFDFGMPLLTERKIKVLRKKSFDLINISTRINPGPVHFNFPFDKPFEPDSFTDNISKTLLDISNNKKSINFYKQKTGLSDSTLIKKIINDLNKYDKGIIIIGPENYRNDFANNIIKLSEKLKYPILVDGTSQLRFNTKAHNNIVCNYDAFLRNSNFTNKNKPDIVLHFGRTVTSKGVEDYLSKLKCRIYLINEFGDLFDPSNNTTTLLKMLHSIFCKEIISKLTKKNKNNTWLSSFINADNVTSIIKSQFIYSAKFPSESRIVNEVLKLIPDYSNIMLSNSLPVRDFDNFASKDFKRLNIFNNRGASGVDGIISTSMGIAARSNKLTILLIGDIAFYHDLNGLLNENKNSIPLIIILINNSGGGIFHFLPIKKYKQIFKKYFLTPHNLNFNDIVNGFGIKYTRIKNWKNFKSVFNSSIKSSKLQVIEIKTNSEESYKLRKLFWDKVRKAF